MNIVKNIKLIPILLFIAILFAPSAGFSAAERPCHQPYVYFGNGVWNDWGEAANSADLLSRRLESHITGTDLEGAVEYDVFYNPSTGAICDLLETFLQNFETDVSQFWRFLAGLEPMPDILQDRMREISELADAAIVVASPEELREYTDTYNQHLREGHPVVVVAHSQGNLWANIAYLGIEHENLDRFGIVSVANPDDHVAGNGPYTTIDEDLVIWAVRDSLPANLNNFFGINLRDYSGHKFIDSYMASGHPAATKILDDVVSVIESHSGCEYLVVTAGGLSFVWDPETNDYAELEYNGHEITYPITESLLTTLLKRKNSGNVLRDLQYIGWASTETCSEDYFTYNLFFENTSYEQLGGSGSYGDPRLFSRRNVWDKNGESVVEWAGCSETSTGGYGHDYDITWYTYATPCAAHSLYIEDQGEMFQTSMASPRRYARLDGTLLFDETSYFTPLADEQVLGDNESVVCFNNDFFGAFGRAQAIRNTQDTLFTQIYHAKLLSYDPDEEYPIVDIIHSGIAVDYGDSLGNPFERERNEDLETAMLNLLHIVYEDIDQIYVDGVKVNLKIDYASR